MLPAQVTSANEYKRYYKHRQRMKRRAHGAERYLYLKRVSTTHNFSVTWNHGPEGERFIVEYKTASGWIPIDGWGGRTYGPRAENVVVKVYTHLPDKKVLFAFYILLVGL